MIGPARFAVVFVPSLALAVALTALVWWLGDKAEWTIIASAAIGTGIGLAGIRLCGEWVTYGPRRS